MWGEVRQFSRTGSARRNLAICPRGCVAGVADAVGDGRRRGVRISAEGGVAAGLPTPRRPAVIGPAGLGLELLRSWSIASPPRPACNRQRYPC